ncbi:DUF4442 domain-containing protein [Magnetospirillum aberrantis]|uniref:DUF4442 domain-containing protein n=1 Tax=Magnetospirillum aberrantis SpK TaxID=908842 RepID=A0A7C9UYC0_9PROT|nr:DUF4442 domain-containing protein [Magnetospirillum aberrantis]NFV79633.1 DUF4442 domain-containing protein [Magnetospirillum aberrantis SpK]
MTLSPRLLRVIFNLWPPFFGTGIHVRRISGDWREIDVEARLRWYNRNIVGSHFGGNLFAMTDPFYMTMLMGVLGSGYVVWDKAANIDFVRPGRGTVTARFRLDESQIAALRAATENGDKALPEYVVEITDAAGEVVARVHKTLYVRRKSSGARERSAPLAA